MEQKADGWRPGLRINGGTRMGIQAVPPMVRIGELAAQFQKYSAVDTRQRLPQRFGLSAAENERLLVGRRHAL